MIKARISSSRRRSKTFRSRLHMLQQQRPPRRRPKRQRQHLEEETKTIMLMALS
jgi:hypothetical protein